MYYSITNNMERFYFVYNNSCKKHELLYIKYNESCKKQESFYIEYNDSCKKHEFLYIKYNQSCKKQEFFYIKYNDSCKKYNEFYLSVWICLAASLFGMCLRYVRVKRKAFLSIFNHLATKFFFRICQPEAGFCYGIGLSLCRTRLFRLCKL